MMTMTLHYVYCMQMQGDEIVSMELEHVFLLTGRQG